MKQLLGTLGILVAVVLGSVLLQMPAKSETKSERKIVVVFWIDDASKASNVRARHEREMLHCCFLPELGKNGFFVTQLLSGTNLIATYGSLASGLRATLGDYQDSARVLAVRWEVYPDRTNVTVKDLSAFRLGSVRIEMNDNWRRARSVRSGAQHSDEVANATLDLVTQYMNHFSANSKSEPIRLQTAR